MPTLQPGSTSQAFDVDIGQTVSVTPGSGGTMLVEYTTNSETDIRNGSATWQTWTAGTVSAATSDVAMFPMFARVTAYTVAGSYELSGSGLCAVPNQYLAWKSDVVSARNTASAAAVVGAGMPASALSAISSGAPMLSGYGPDLKTRNPTVFVDFRNLASLTVAAWTGGTGTLEVSRDVLYRGMPTLKVTMPAACTRVELGVSSGVVLPTDWTDNIQCPMYIPDKTDFGVTQVYLGDSTYTAIQLVTYDVAAVGASGWNNPRWDNRAALINEPASTNPGTINSGNVAQAKIRVNKTSGAASRVFYIALLSDAPRHRAKILFTADDGYDEWYSWLRSQAILHGVPWALGIDRFYVGSAGFMTAAQIAEMSADSSGLFEFYSHGKNNQGYSDIGAAAYHATVVECGEYLRTLGVANPYRYHPYVKGQRGDDLDALMLSSGVLVARLAVGVLGETYKPVTMQSMYGSNAKIKARIGLSLEATTTLAAAKTAVDNACTAGGVLYIMAHEFVASGAVGLQWTYADTVALMQHAKMREAQGLCDVSSMSQIAPLIS